MEQFLNGYVEELFSNISGTISVSLALKTFCVYWDTKYSK